jgi:hypothetical protein
MTVNTLPASEVVGVPSEVYKCDTLIPSIAMIARLSPTLAQYSLELFIHTEIHVLPDKSILF